MTRDPPEKDILGAETEYGIAVRNGRSPVPDFFDQEHTMEFFEHCVGQPLVFSHLQFEKATSVFLLAGDRLYLDHGLHLEFATRETSGPRRLEVCENAGDLLIERGVARANIHWREEGFSFRAYKNNADSKGNSWGSHENYLLHVPALEFSREFVSPLGEFLITRVLFAGNGDVRLIDGRLCYFLSQRLQFVEETATGNTTSIRPIINTRNEPHADSSRFFRLHLIIGDALLWQAAQFLKYSTTLMVLKAIMAGYLVDPPFGILDNVRDLEDACRHFARRSSLHEPVSLNGRRLTIIDVQEEFLKIVRGFYTRERDLTPDDKLTFELWEKIVDLARSPRPHEALSPYVDWAAKEVYIESDMERRSYDWDRPEDLVARKTRAGDGNMVKAGDHLLQLNIQFHELSPNGIARKIAEQPDSEVVRIITKEEIERALFNTEPDTRAHARTLELAWANSMGRTLGRKIKVSSEVAGGQPREWVHLKFKDELTTIREFEDLDPTDPTPHPIEISPK